MGIQVRVVTPKGEEIILDLCESEQQMKKITVLQLKEKINAQLGTNDDIRVIFRTEVLKDTFLLPTYGIRHMSTVHTVMRVKGGG